MAEQLIEYAFDEYFDKVDDVDTYFSDDDSENLVKQASDWAKDGARTSKKKDFTQRQIDTIGDNWKTYLPDSVNDRIISKNLKLGIKELDSLKVSGDASKRVGNRLDELISEENVDNLAKLNVSYSTQEKINKKISSDITGLSRSSFEKLGVLNRSVRRMSSQLDISQDELRDALIREGFTVTDNGIIRR